MTDKERVYKMRTFLRMLLLTVLITVFIAVGCGESDISGRQARLVGNENLDLKKQLKTCNNTVKKREKEIEKQKELLAQCKEEQIQIGEDTREAVVNVLDQLGESSKVIEKLTAENEQLKAELEQLKKQISQAHGN